MFMVSAFASMLFYFAAFSLLERAFKSDRALSLFKNYPVAVALQNPSLLFRLTSIFSYVMVVISILLSFVGIISFQTFLNYQTWVVGYLIYHILFETLYPATNGTGINLLHMVMIPASFVYSYGIYSPVYMITFLLSGVKIYEFCSGIFQTKMHPDVESTFRHIDIGIIVFLLTFSIFTWNLIPSIFFTGLFGAYFNLV